MQWRQLESDWLCQDSGRGNRNLARVSIPFVLSPLPFPLPTYRPLVRNLGTAYTRFLQECCKNLGQILQDSWQECLIIRQDPCRILTRFLQNSCKNYPKTLQVFLRFFQNFSRIIQHSCKNYTTYFQDSSKIHGRFCKNYTRFLQELYMNLPKFWQNPCKILGYLESVTINGEQLCKILERFLQELFEILQQSSKNFARIIQDPNMILAKSCEKYPRIIQESGKYYPRIMQESCNIKLRIMQYVMRCVNIAFFCSAKWFQKLIARCVQSVHSGHILLKRESLHFTIDFQFQRMTQHFLLRAWGKATSLEIDIEKERKREQFIVHLYRLEYFSSDPKQSNIATLVKCYCKILKILSWI